MKRPYQARTPDSARPLDTPKVASAAPPSIGEAGLSQKYCLVVIPTYNEALNIERLVMAILSQSPAFDVLVVDDNSPDGTGDLVAALTVRSARVRLLRRAGKLGLGSAYIEGFHEGLRQGYRYLCEMDADFSHQPHYLPMLLAAAERTADVALGSRTIRGGRVEHWSWVRQLISKGGSLYARAILGMPIHDCTSGFKCFRADVLQQIDLDSIGSNGYAFQVELSYRCFQAGFRLHEIPIVFPNRVAGQSKMSGPIVWEAAAMVLKLRYSPSLGQSQHRTGTRPLIGARHGPTAGLIGRDWPEKRLVFVLACLAVIMLITTCIAMFILPQAPGRMSKPSAALIGSLPLWSFIASLPLPIPQQSLSVALCLLVVSTIRFVCYGLAIAMCWMRWGGSASLRIVVSSALLFFAVAAFAFPNVDSDIYNYIASGRVGAIHGSNPYRVAPDQLPTDPIYPYANPQYTAIPGDNKLPVWTLVNMLLAKVAGDNVVTSLLLYRGVFFLINGINLGLIIRIFNSMPSHGRLAGVLLYAWNPIIITYGQSKVDTLMTCFLLLSILALARTYQKHAVVALTISVLVKLITLPLLAVYLLRELRERTWRGLGPSALLIGVVALICYVPFGLEPVVLQQHVRLLGMAGSASPIALRLVLYIGFLLITLWVGLRNSSGIRGLLIGWTLVSLVFAIFLTRLGFSWYLMTLIALVGVTLEWRLTLMTIALSFASFLLNVWDSTSKGAFRLPDLFGPPRSIIYLAFIGVAALSVAMIHLGYNRRAAYSR